MANTIYSTHGPYVMRLKAIYAWFSDFVLLKSSQIANLLSDPDLIIE